ncbi:unnamed protein product [Closterium sp. Naga37s-1]|nr:unnamed protein product [Closterium sp. Naga37s-1]
MPKGAYTTTRTFGNGSHLLLWDFHLDRITQSLLVLAEAHPELNVNGEQNGEQQEQQQQQQQQQQVEICLMILLCGQQAFFGEAATAATAPAIRETAETAETAATAANAPGVEVYVHASTVCPTNPFSSHSLPPPVCAAVMGPGRHTPLAKFSSWPLVRRALEAARPAEARDVILSNDGNALLEGITSNLFVLARAEPTSDSNSSHGSPWHGFDLQTASLESGILPGSIRQAIIDTCNERGIPLRIKTPQWSERALWVEAFVTNALSIVQPVSSILMPATWPSETTYDSWQSVDKWLAWQAPALEPVDNRVGITILQHPKEKYHPLGSARIALLGLQRVRVVVVPLGRGRPGLQPKDPCSRRTLMGRSGRGRWRNGAGKTQGQGRKQGGGQGEGPEGQGNAQGVDQGEEEGHGQGQWQGQGEEQGYLEGRMLQEGEEPKQGRWVDQAQGKGDSSERGNARGGGASTGGDGGLVVGEGGEVREGESREGEKCVENEVEREGSRDVGASGPVVGEEQGGETTNGAPTGDSSFDLSFDLLPFAAADGADSDDGDGAFGGYHDADGSSEEDGGGMCSQDTTEGTTEAGTTGLASTACGLSRFDVRASGRDRPPFKALLPKTPRFHPNVPDTRPLASEVQALTIQIFIIVKEEPTFHLSARSLFRLQPSQALHSNTGQRQVLGRIAQQRVHAMMQLIHTYLPTL